MYGLIHNLNVVRKELVELGDLCRDREIDGSVTNFDNEATKDIGVDLVVDNELLAGADKRRLGDGRLETADGSVVERSSGSDGGLDNALGGVGKSLKLNSDGRKERQSVVLGKNVEEVGDGGLGVGSTGKSFDNGLLVVGRKGRVAQDLNELLILSQK